MPDAAQPGAFARMDMMMTLPLTSLARLMGQTALVACLIPAAALAQETVIDLAPVVVDGIISGNDPVEGANPATATGSKMAVPVTEIPQSVSVIGAATLAAENVTKVDGALAYAAGVQAQPYGYDSDTNWFFVRGFAATATGAFIDGLPSYSYGFGGFYADPAGLERIEVLRGPASALYGAANPGGIVNMVTKRPTGTPGGTDTLGVDSTGRAWLQTDREGVTASGLQWRFVGKAERTDDMGVFEPGSRVYLAPSVSFQTAGGTDVTLGATYTNIAEDHVGGGWLPYVGTVVDAPFGRIDRDFNTGEPGYDDYDRDQFTLSSEIAHDLGNGWRVVNNTRLGQSDVSESSVYAYGYTGFSATPSDAAGTLSRIFFEHDTKTKTALNDLRLEGSFDTGALSHRMMVGLDAKWFQMDQVQASVAWPGAATGLSVVSPVYGTVQPATTPYLDNVVTQRQFGLYLQDQIKWGEGWIGTVNLRHDQVETTVSTDRTTGAAGSNRKDGETSWRLGLAKEFGNGVTAYASASSYFNPQVVTSADGNAISPETGRQAEVGVKWSPSEATMLTFSAFDMNRENISQSMWNGAGYTYSQLGRVNSQGFEFEAQHDFGNGLVMNASATVMDVKVKADLDATLVGKTPYSTVENMASFKLAYTPAALEALTVTGGVRFLGASWADNANTLKVPSTTLLDASVSYDFAENWVGNLAVTNLTDEVYVASCQNATGCYYGEERRVSLSLNHKF